MEFSFWIPLFSAFFGAVAAGLFQTIQQVVDRKREREAILSALAMEVRSICKLMRLREYLPGAQEILYEMKQNTELVQTVIADIREDYFSVFHALSPKLGLLKPSDGASVVEFYSICKSIKDSCYPDGIMVENQNRELAIANIEQLVVLMREALQVGDQICQISKVSLGIDLENSR